MKNIREILEKEYTFKNIGFFGNCCIGYIFGKRQIKKGFVFKINKSQIGIGLLFGIPNFIISIIKLKKCKYIIPLKK